MLEELDAQLFVYEKGTGDILIDTIQADAYNISVLKNRKYNDGSSYEQLLSTDKGFVSFLSAYRNENLHLHYSSIDEFGWMIALGRYDSQVHAGTYTNVSVTCGAKVLGDVTMHKGSLAAAGAVVVKDVPENAIAGGVPARIIAHKDENNLDFQG